MRIILVIIISVFTFQKIYSQTLTGVVKDKETTELIPYATVILKNSKGDFLEGTTTNEKGRYLIDYKSGSYIIEISFIGYKKYTSTVKIAEKTNVDVLLETDVTDLDEVVIATERTTVQQLIDKKVINVGKDLLSSGGDAINVLSQLAEVQADLEGNISLRGSQNVNVLINGKPSPLSTNELLQQISADDIIKVEIITSPSAKYQANGLTGIINIITKNKVQKGLSISANTNANTIGAYSGRTAISYGKSKVSYQFGTSYNKNRSLSERVRSRSGMNPFTQISDYEYDGNVYRLNGSIDWFPNERNEFSLGINYTLNEHDFINDGTILQNNISTFQSALGFHSHKTTTINGNYRYNFENKNDFLEVDVQLTDNTNDLRSDFRPNLAVLDNFSDNVVFISNTAIDYSRTLSDKVKIEAGGLWNRETLNNNLIFLDGNNDQFSENRFNNTQSTYAAYGLVTYDINKLKAQLGLRGELFERNANLLTDGTLVKNDFTNLFPSLHVSYEVKENQVFTFGFNRRISRPSLRQLNPITIQTNEFSLRQGNPDLNPEFSNNFDASYQFKKKGFNTTIDFSYRLKESVIVQNNFLNSDGINVTTYLNNGTTDAYVLGFSADIKPYKWLNSNFGINWNYEEFRNDQIGFSSNLSRSYNLLIRNQITFSKKTSAILSWNYTGKSTSFLSNRQPIQNIDIGVRHKIFKNKGNINIRVSDIFDTRRRQGENFGVGFIEAYNYKYVSRILNFSFSYRFDGGKIKKRKKKSRNYSS